jgi:hypothetical protein
MRITFCTLMNLLGVVICLGYPFLTVLRARGFGKPSLVGWGGIVLWCVSFSLGVPAVAYCFSHEVGHKISDWVPEPTGIPVIALFGWWPPVMAAVVALGIRRVLRRLCPGTLLRLERGRGV